MEINKIYNEDCLKTISRMPDDFIDLTITSPPYNVDLGNNKFNSNGYDVIKDNLPHEEYINGLMNVFTGIFQKTKNGGRCVINIGDGQNGKIATHSDIIQFMKKIGWLTMAVIIWDKQNITSRTAWGSFASPSSPSFPKAFEYIMIFAKGDYKLKTIGKTDLSKEEFIKWSLAKWNFSGEKIMDIGHLDGHPAPFPIELPYRCIKMLSWIGATIYDCYMGSGTTAIASKELDRNFIGSEISEHYYQLSMKRINRWVKQTELF